MQIETDRQPRGPTEEGLALSIYVKSGEPQHWQFKIDAWSTKADGLYHLRLDALGFLANVSAQSVFELYSWLELLNAAAMLKARRRMTPKPHDHWPRKIVVQYFKAARAAALAELEPLLHSADN
ncbi:MAG: hypothetical protein WB586_00110 [Chthoniobacterales bacterium]